MGCGRGAARRRVCSSRFSTALRLHAASNMAVLVEMDCRQLDRFAAVVSHVIHVIHSIKLNFFKNGRQVGRIYQRTLGIKRFRRIIRLVNTEIGHNKRQMRSTTSYVWKTQ